MQPIDAGVDHMRGGGDHLIVEYGDYECPYSRKAYREIERLERRVGGQVRFAFRHFPLSDIHPHAMGAAQAAEAAALQGKFWEMHEVLYSNQDALEPEDLEHYASQVGLDVARFKRDRLSEVVDARVRRDVADGNASGEVLGTPTLYIDGRVYRGGYDHATLLEALAS
ncbi:MAG TPA: DsbA family protein [Candidatus Dormibacteraeota bacterium]|nr:DsbA family protein [Candidatus Dormibacteraeota bacterium]